MRFLTILPLVLLPFGLALVAGPGRDAADFSRRTIDVGMVVSDIQKSAAFYTDLIGFTELEGFDVPADFCKSSGLTNDHPLSVRVFVLGEGDDSTKLKLMQVAGSAAKKGDNLFIHSQLGLSYLTIFVTDTNAALERLAAAGVKPLGEGPVLIGEDPAGPYLSVVRDPDGNLIELIGPKE